MAVPLGVVTLIRPLAVKLLGTASVILVAETTVKVGTAKIPMRTSVAPVKSVPVIVTTVPVPPPAGVKLVIVGAGVVTTKASAAEVPPPGAGEVTLTAKLPALATAVAGTAAVS